MSVLRATIVLAAVAAAAAACGQGESDIHIEGTITSAATQDSIGDAEIRMSYRMVSPLDPGVVIARSDSAGHYVLRGTDAPCEGLSVRVTAVGFQQSAPVTPVCDKAVQLMNFALQP